MFVLLDFYKKIMKIKWFCLNLLVENAFFFQIQVFSVQIFGLKMQFYFYVFLIQILD
jgi:hypothetical protein